MTDQKDLNNPPQQPSPFYPPYPIYPQEDEISLFDLLRVLLKRKLTILGLTALTTLIAVAYALLSPSVYEAQSILLPPTEKQVGSFSIQGVQGAQGFQITVSVEQAFNSFKQHLYSARRQVFQDMNLLKVFAGRIDENTNNEERVFSGFNESLTIVALKGKKDEFLIPITTVSMEGSDPELIAEIINHLVQTASKNAIAELVSNIEAKVSSRKNFLVEQIQLLKDRNTKQIHDELGRRRKETQYEQATLNNRIDALREKALHVREGKIFLLSEQAQIAHKLGIKDPYIPGTGIYTEVNIEGNDPLFLRGERSLLAEIKVLQERVTDDPYISELRPLQTKISLLEKNKSLEESRIKNTPSTFLGAIRGNESELTRLKMVSLDPRSVSVVQVNQTAFPSESPIKPKRRLIVALGAVLGLMIGVFGALFLNFLEKQK